MRRTAVSRTIHANRVCRRIHRLPVGQSVCCISGLVLGVAALSLGRGLLLVKHLARFVGRVLPLILFGRAHAVEVHLCQVLQGDHSFAVDYPAVLLLLTLLECGSAREVTLHILCCALPYARKLRVSSCRRWLWFVIPKLLNVFDGIHPIGNLREPFWVIHRVPLNAGVS